MVIIRKGDSKGVLKTALCIAIMLFTFFSPLTGATTAADETRMLIPLGYTAGIKMFADGVLVVGISQESSMTQKNPAKAAGLEPGDVITEINSVKITSTEELKNEVQKGGKLRISLLRNGTVKDVELTPVAADENGALKIGAWVRDSMAGIGTLTFYDPQSGVFGALGHGINDIDTAALMPLSTGALVPSSIASVRKGEAGSPGELKGSFDVNGEYGALYANTEHGVFGKMQMSDIKTSVEPLPAASKNEIKLGKAAILSNVDGKNIEEFEIEITKIYLDGGKAPRDMSIEITDERLIEKTGGIVQGMSGSPIIQNGRIIGAVTHVLINQPRKGYAIFIENMLASSDKAIVNTTRLNKAA
ncbi:MAG: SpoIVB peptidase [Oscillospiraceae bacterium]|nr:SpoIVB peptidase [Oscillospiraceae bacterium]